MKALPYRTKSTSLTDGELFILDVVFDGGAFLHYWPMYPARRKTKTVADFGLLPWRSFGRLYAGLACYDEQREWGPDEHVAHTDMERRHRATLEANRTWWWCVGELQWFIEAAA